MPIQACADCGSRQVRGDRVPDARLLGTDESRYYVCKACGHQGMPLLFDDPADYAAFRADVADPPLRDATDPPPEDGTGRDLPDAGHATVVDPATGETRQVAMPLFITGLVALLVFLGGFLLLDRLLGWTGGDQGPWVPFLASMALGVLVAWAFLKVTVTTRGRGP